MTVGVGHQLKQMDQTSTHVNSGGAVRGEARGPWELLPRGLNFLQA